MKMWTSLLPNPVTQSLPLLFKTTIVYGDGNAQTHLRLGYFDAAQNAFIESGVPDQHYRESVDCWYQFPMPEQRRKS